MTLTAESTDRLRVLLRRQGIVDTWREHDGHWRALAELLTALTPREAEVLEQLALGTSVRAIAEQGAVSEGTVWARVKSVLRKLRVNSQLAAVAVYRSVDH